VVKTPWTAAGHQPGRARPLAASGRQQEDAGFCLLEAARASQAQRQRPDPSGHSRGGLNSDTGCLCEPGVAARIGRPVVDPLQVPKAEAGVMAHAWHAASLRLAVDHTHIAHAEPPQLQGSSQPCRPGADDQHITATLRHHQP
jgi:hypothetical protein